VPIIYTDRIGATAATKTSSRVHTSNKSAAKRDMVRPKGITMIEKVCAVLSWIMRRVNKENYVLPVNLMIW
jgi:hypothetical protein